MTKTAVVLFNLGGPDNPAAVRPFMFNLFNDPAIIGLPGLLRWLLAALISRRREPVATAIYAEIGGHSPLLKQTQAQAAALETALGRSLQVRVFTAMRYWHPMSEAVAREVAAFAPDEVILLPLYPQFSTATTASSLTAWRRAATAAGVRAPTRAVCCYPLEESWIACQVALLGPALREAAAIGRPRFLFSAHGLPKRTIARGDPFQWQIEQTAAAVVGAAAARGDTIGDWVVCYQSRVGPMEWIGPAMGDEIDRAGADGVPVVVVPIAFVSEHSETLVELDITYRRRAEAAGVPVYVRVPAAATHPMFISCLAKLVETTRERATPEIVSAAGERLCPAQFARCAMT
jgi:ferrochelatase